MGKKYDETDRGGIIGEEMRGELDKDALYASVDFSSNKKRSEVNIANP